MHLSINITALSYDGNNYLSFDAVVTRSDNPVNNTYTISGDSIQVGQDSGDGIPFEVFSNAKIYALLGDECYNQLIGQTSLSKDPVSYVFIGLSIVGPYKIVDHPSEFLSV